MPPPGSPSYQPRFGGYDPVAITRERAVAGHPLFWALAGERFYLFYSAENHDAFFADPPGIFATAERNWAQVESMIAR